MYSFDVFTAHHDAIKGGAAMGGYVEIRSRVLISDAYTYIQAYEIAACMAVALHGGMPTRVLPRY